METINETVAIKMTIVGTSLAIMLLSIEYIAWTRKKLLDKSSLFSWDIASLQYGWLYRGWRIQLLNIIYGERVFLSITIIRSILCILMILYIKSDVSTFSYALLFLFITSLVINIRHAHGRDGADEMVNILLAGLVAYCFTNTNHKLHWIGPIFILGQLTLSYFISGFYKLKSKSWRSGNAIIQVVSTKIYGHSTLAKLIKQKGIKLLFSWFIIVWEVSFPLVWLIPHPYNNIWIVSGIFFHVSIAIFMGLNTFLLAFLSCYPLLYLYTNVS